VYQRDRLPRARHVDVGPARPDDLAAEDGGHDGIDAAKIEQQPAVHRLGERAEGVVEAREGVGVQHVSSEIGASGNDRLRRRAREGAPGGRAVSRKLRRRANAETGG
jgi:hypothetical protein